MTATGTGVGVDVVTFGEVMGMFVADDAGDLADVTRFTRSLAGAEYNVAVGLARLGHTVAWVGRLGDDPVGRSALAAMLGAGLVTDAVAIAPGERTGLQLKSRTIGGDPEVVYFRSHSAGRELTATPSSDALVRSARHLHATGIPLALSGRLRTFAHDAVTLARRSGVRVSVDPNLRPSLWASTREMVRETNALAVRADWVLPGLDEGRLLTGAREPAGVAAFYLERGVQLVAVKDGRRGAHVFTADDHVRVGPLPVTAVDTVGAGDGFAAGLISAGLDNLDPAARALRAAGAGALATTAFGDQEGLPTRVELAALLTAAGRASTSPLTTSSTLPWMVAS
ncbi:sugar kinase [Pengzhenrongella sicca]|uniref:Sugar kinase n=1 Tax=Pengzhenrongella sicca TaxID=2819238 RepID=A0A8A4ZEE8_9MICO|nr:sugar kinase [Pengzhenrongella sicca]QTE28078.1 sugar kinase [Pengzhenrongella sicca]